MKKRNGGKIIKQSVAFRVLSVSLFKSIFKIRLVKEIIAINTSRNRRALRNEKVHRNMNFYILRMSNCLWLSKNFLSPRHTSA